MVMGPTHAMSGACLALAGIVTYSATIGTVHPTIALMFSLVAAGAALAPDIDSGSSTVVNSFGIFGKIAHHISNSISVAVYNITKTSREEPITNGHRTFFHTTFMAIMMGLLVAFLTLPTTMIDVFGKEYTLGQFNAIIILGIFINLSLAGLLEKQIKKARKKYGPYLLMATSFILAGILSIWLPHPEDSSFGLDMFGLGGSYAYIGIAVAFGWFVHLLGDAITKMGVPMAWPVKIRGKRWYDISLPAFMRIRANGTFEKVILLPLFSIATLGLIIYTFILYL